MHQGFQHPIVAAGSFSRSASKAAVCGAVRFGQPLDLGRARAALSCRRRVSLRRATMTYTLITTLTSAQRSICTAWRLRPPSAVLPLRPP